MKFCARPFRNLEVVPNGDAFACCSGWLPVSIGNVLKIDARQAFSSTNAQDIRASILDGSFRYCTACPFLRDGAGPVREVAELPPWATLQPAHITFVNLADDRTRNLACPSCREGLIVAGERARNDIARIREATLGNGVLQELQWLSVSGAGDPFTSASDRELLRSLDPKSCPSLSIRLHTNGQRFDAIGWDGLGPIRVRVRSVEISIDAATDTTYALNRGGDWGRLQRNLAFVAKLRANGPVRRLQLSFVVQANNWREMESFVELGRRVGADEVFFSAMGEWWTMPDYRLRAVHRLWHHERAAMADLVATSAVLNQPGVTIDGALRSCQVTNPPTHSVNPS